MENEEKHRIERVRLDHIRPSRWQAREKQFDAAALWGLAQSIKAQGLINPPVVFTTDGWQTFELVAGERRVRALVALAWAEGLESIDEKAAVTYLADHGLGRLPPEAQARLEQERIKIPVRLVEADDLGHLHQMAVVENLERDNLDPLEEARALSGLRQDLGWTQEELAARIGRSQAYVQQRLALLDLDRAAVLALQNHPSGFSIALARRLTAAPRAYQAALAGYYAAAGTVDRDAATVMEQIAKLALIDFPAGELAGRILYWPNKDPRSASNIAGQVNAIWDQRTRTLDPITWPRRAFPCDWDPRRVEGLLKMADENVLPSPAACEECRHVYSQHDGDWTWCLMPACFDRKNKLWMQVQQAGAGPEGEDVDEWESGEAFERIAERVTTEKSMSQLAGEATEAAAARDREIRERERYVAEHGKLPPRPFAERAIRIEAVLQPAEVLGERAAVVTIGFAGETARVVKGDYDDLFTLIENGIEGLRKTTVDHAERAIGGPDAVRV